MNLRGAEPGDYGFVLSSFISSFREASTHAEGLTGRQIASLLTNLISNGWTCTVAEMDNVIAGWVVHDKNQRLAWVYSRTMFRRQGLALLLFKSVGIDPRLPVVSPFVPNRNKAKCPLRLTIHQRPFLVMPNAETAAVH